MTTNVLQKVSAYQICSRNPDQGINDVHEIGVLSIKIIRQKPLNRMNQFYQDNRCYSGKYPNYATENQDKCLIAYVP